MEERRNLTTMTTIAVKTIVVVKSMRDMNITTMAKIVAKKIVVVESMRDMNIITTIKTIAAMMIVAVESIKNTSIIISTLRVWLRKSIV